MTFDDIDLLVRRANPVPDPEALEPTGSEDGARNERRRVIMQIQELRDQSEVRRRPDRKRTRPPAAVILAAAALVVVALVAASALIGDDGTDDPTATATMSPRDVADSFMAALGDRDADLASTFVADEALVEPGGLDGLRAELRWREANGYDVLPEPCEVTTETAVRTILRCPYGFNAIHSDELGYPPFEGSFYRVVVGDDGRISSFLDEMEYTDNRFSVEVFEPFVAWLEENHPDDVTVMLGDGADPGMTDESIELWERRSREYVDARN